MVMMMCMASSELYVSKACSLLLLQNQVCVCVLYYLHCGIAD